MKHQPEASLDVGVVQQDSGALIRTANSAAHCKDFHKIDCQFLEASVLPLSQSRMSQFVPKEPFRGSDRRVEPNHVPAKGVGFGAIVPGHPRDSKNCLRDGAKTQVQVPW